MTSARRSGLLALGIWAFAFGYFACYVPYSALTKALSKGLLPGMGGESVGGFALLPLSVGASTLGMLAFLTLAGWWRFAGRRLVLGVLVPWPGRWTFLSGLCTAAIVATTTLSYTFAGISIVFVMLLMRGGVLIIAPVVDALTGRRTRWFSWVGLALSLLALVVAFSEEGGYEITLLAAVDVLIYLAAYFVRLRFMSRLAKSDDEAATKRYFVEEQMVATPAMFLLLVVAAVVGEGDMMLAIRAGFTDVWSAGVWPWIIVVGLLSQGTGVFGGLVLLDKSENTYSVPVNRSSSVLAGVLASAALTVLFGTPFPSAYQIGGAALILAAILFLSLPPLLEKRRGAALGEG